MKSQIFTGCIIQKLQPFLSRGNKQFLQASYEDCTDLPELRPLNPTTLSLVPSLFRTSPFAFRPSGFALLFETFTLFLAGFTTLALRGAADFVAFGWIFGGERLRVDVVSLGVLDDLLDSTTPLLPFWFTTLRALEVLTDLEVLPLVLALCGLVALLTLLVVRASKLSFFLMASSIRVAKATSFLATRLVTFPAFWGDNENLWVDRKYEKWILLPVQKSPSYVDISQWQTYIANPSHFRHKLT